MCANHMLVAPCYGKHSTELRLAVFKSKVIKSFDCCNTTCQLQRDYNLKILRRKREYERKVLGCLTSTNGVCVQRDASVEKHRCMPSRFSFVNQRVQAATHDVQGEFAEHRDTKG